MRALVRFGGQMVSQPTRIVHFAQLIFWPHGSPICRIWAHCAARSPWRGYLRAPIGSRVVSWLSPWPVWSHFVLLTALNQLESSIALWVSSKTQTPPGHRNSSSVESVRIQIVFLAISYTPWSVFVLSVTFYCLLVNLNMGLFQSAEIQGWRVCFWSVLPQVARECKMGGICEPAVTFVVTLSSLRSIWALFSFLAALIGVAQGFSIGLKTFQESGKGCPCRFRSQMTAFHTFHGALCLLCV